MEPTDFNSMKGDPKEPNIKNTFVTNCRNDYFSVSQIIFGLEHGLIKFRILPEDVKFRISVEIMRKHPEIKTQLKISKWKMKSYSKDTLEELK